MTVNTLETAIYIDYDNLYRSINESYSSFTGPEVIQKIVESLVEKEGCNVKLVKAFCDFKNSYKEIDELQHNLVELRHINSVGNGKSNASDIGLAIDVMKSLFNSKKFDTYVIVSSDSDMLPLILELIYQGKEVILVYLESKISDKYTEILVQKQSLKTLKIEDILDIQVHRSITSEQLEGNTELLSLFINTINSTMNGLYDKFNEKTTVSQKVVKDGLKAQAEIPLEDLDTTIILDFLKSKEYVRIVEKNVEVNGQPTKRNSCVLDIQKIQAAGITLNDESKITYTVNLAPIG